VNKPRKQPIADLPRGVSVARVRSGSGVLYWRVRLGKKFTGGSVKRGDYVKLEDARVWIFGDAQKERAPKEGILQMVDGAKEAINGMSSKQITEAAAAFHRLKGSTLSLSAAVDFALRHTPKVGAISIADAIKDCLEYKKKNKRPTYVADLGKRWRRLERWLPKIKKSALNSIVKHDIREFLAQCNLAPKGERNMLRNLSVLFGWAKKRNHIESNPCQGIDVEDAGERKPVRILTITELRSMLDLAKSGFTLEIPPEHEVKKRERFIRKFGGENFAVHPMELIPWLTLGCFSGFRPEEAEKIEAAEIDLKRKHTDLPASKSKTHERRLVKMSENQYKWLSLAPLADGPIVPTNFRRKKWALREKMGWKGWPADILRHSFGSYHLAMHENSGTTAYMMGHKNPRMLYEYYRDVVKDQEDVDAYWAFEPTQSRKEVSVLQRKPPATLKSKVPLRRPR